MNMTQPYMKIQKPIQERPNTAFPILQKCFIVAFSVSPTAAAVKTFIVCASTSTNMYKYRKDRKNIKTQKIKIIKHILIQDKYIKKHILIQDKSNISLTKRDEMCSIG